MNSRNRSLHPVIGMQTAWKRVSSLLYEFITNPLKDVYSTEDWIAILTRTFEHSQLPHSEIHERDLYILTQLLLQVTPFYFKLSESSWMEASLSKSLATLTRSNQARLVQLRRLISVLRGPLLESLIEYWSINTFQPTSQGHKRPRLERDKETANDAFWYLFSWILVLVPSHSEAIQSALFKRTPPSLWQDQITSITETLSYFENLSCLEWNVKIHLLWSIQRLWPSMGSHLNAVLDLQSQEPKPAWSWRLILMAASSNASSWPFAFVDALKRTASVYLNLTETALSRWLKDESQDSNHFETVSEEVYDEQLAIWTVLYEHRLALPEQKEALNVPDSAIAAIAEESHEIINSPLIEGYVLTAQRQELMTHLIQDMSLSAPILLYGSAGCGKSASITALAHHLSFAVDRVMTLHVGDVSDSKALIGNYTVTSYRDDSDQDEDDEKSGSDPPGTFVWKAGPLTRAVTQGYWVVLDAYQDAKEDVRALLVSLLQSRTLFVAARGQTLKAHPQFRLLSCVTTRHANESVGSLQFGGCWSYRSVSLPDSQELVDWISVRFSDFTVDLKEAIMRVYQVACQWQSGLAVCSELPLDWHQGAPVSMRARMRSFTPRDLMHLAQRVTSLQEKSMERIWQEACDCFAASIADSHIRYLFSIRLAVEALHLNESHITSLLAIAPSVTNIQNGLNQVGRASISSASSNRSLRAAVAVRPQMPFAYTFPASKHLEQLAVAVSGVDAEPVLLVGETAAGKTTLLQHLAELAGRSLTVLNLSQQSDGSDLLGAYRPFPVAQIGRALKDRLETVFVKTFSRQRNARFLDAVKTATLKEKWTRLTQLVRNAIGMASEKLQKESENQEQDDALRRAWTRLSLSLHRFESQIHYLQHHPILFQYQDGPLVQALRRGDWILLDEINLAQDETLQTLGRLLDSRHSSILLTECGATKAIPRHPEFRLFAAMNPSTDVGKKELPAAIRARFTEIYVDEISTTGDVQMIVSRYLQNCVGYSTALAARVVTCFMGIKEMARQGELYDGTGRKPHYSLRTLTRALSFATTCSEHKQSMAAAYGLIRAVYEGFCATFSTLLDAASMKRFHAFLQSTLLTELDLAVLSRVPPCPGRENEFVLVQGFWLHRGPLAADEEQSRFIITPTVKQHLTSVARAVSARRFPVLLQGPTSAGKTSLVTYLASITGHRCIRINNHEHTDLQEYLGSYVDDSEGRFVYREGALVEAVRRGDWLILDELNLAPTDVLEALNRLLDDNREIYIPETQETVRAHPDFLLFATQNPSNGLYGGRKPLSRALRNRFVEIHVDDLPRDEMQTIVAQRCGIAPSQAARLVQVYAALLEARSSQHIFQGRHGLMTLRDLFRWAQRPLLTTQDMAEEGYRLLAERARTQDEVHLIHHTLERVLHCQIDPEVLYDCTRIPLFQQFDSRLKAMQSNHEIITDPTLKSFASIVWTRATRRLFALVYRCLEHKEPVLLVGGTGAGKTSVCQLLAAMFQVPLSIVNCHQHTETTDFLGAQRPSRKRKFSLDSKERLIECLELESGLDRNTMESMSFDALCDAFEALLMTVSSEKRLEWEVLLQQESNDVISSRKESSNAPLFEWRDGPLIQAMKEGHFFLLDEISLADDAVLERLNSVLEPLRSLHLTEGTNPCAITAHSSFQFLATMNPGGDFGKKELSPALRNRFTEIWVPPEFTRTDLYLMIQSKWQDETLNVLTDSMLDFLEGWNQRMPQMVTSLRDILAWIEFIHATRQRLGSTMAFIHGGCMLFVDGIGLNSSLKGSQSTAIVDLKEWAQMQLCQQNDLYQVLLQQENQPEFSFSLNSLEWGASPFYIPVGDHYNARSCTSFSFKAPTTAQNALRVLRAMQLSKAILLEGSPGAGKTTLIQSVASQTGHSLVRINLSEQTDIVDLFGSDLPVEGGANGQFAWRDGPLLQAMKQGHWVLLDELNLASQSVLEGLNACLDHRASVYIPELDRTFQCHAGFRLFAAQNPLSQGGGRKGLPKSFLNRFTKVHVEALTRVDLFRVLEHLYPALEEKFIDRLLTLNETVLQQQKIKMWQGGPWEFNLRDMMRWMDLMQRLVNVTEKRSTKLALNEAAVLSAKTIYLQRLRTKEDRDWLLKQLNALFETEIDSSCPNWFLTPDLLTVGSISMRRTGLIHSDSFDNIEAPLQSTLPALESLCHCLDLNVLSILIGASDTGKTSLVRWLARAVGVPLKVFEMNSSMDTLEILGGFEQCDLKRLENELMQQLEQGMRHFLSSFSLDWNDENVQCIEAWIECQVRPCSTSISQLISCLAHHLPQEFVQSLIFAHQNFDQRVHQSMQGRFEWVDSVLLHAMEQGHWLLLENSNQCTAAVLDRLNSLFEPQGHLSLNERGLVQGQVRVVKPHPQFRLIMTMNPRTGGEMSRAMRNRGVEIVLLDAVASQPVDAVRLYSQGHNETGVRENILRERTRQLLLDQGIYKVQREEEENASCWSKMKSIHWNYKNLLNDSFLWHLERNGILIRNQTTLAHLNNTFLMIHCLSFLSSNGQIAQFDAWLKRLNLELPDSLLRSLATQHHVNRSYLGLAWYFMTIQTNAHEKSAYHQSILYSKGLVSSLRLMHSIVPHLIHLMDQLQTYVWSLLSLGSVDMSFVSDDILHSLYWIWQSISRQGFDLMLFSFHLEALLKISHSAPESLISFLASLAESTIRPRLIQTRLFEASQKPVCVDETLFGEWSQIQVSDAAMRETVVNALATLFLLNEPGQDVETLNTVKQCMSLCSSATSPSVKSISYQQLWHRFLLQHYLILLQGQESILSLEKWITFAIQESSFPVAFLAQCRYACWKQDINILPSHFYALLKYSELNCKSLCGSFETSQIATLLGETLTLSNVRDYDREQQDLVSYLTKIAPWTPSDLPWLEECWLQVKRLLFCLEPNDLVLMALHERHCNTLISFCQSIQHEAIPFLVDALALLDNNNGKTEFVLNQVLKLLAISTLHFYVTKEDTLCFDPTAKLQIQYECQSQRYEQWETELRCRQLQLEHDTGNKGDLNSNVALERLKQELNQLAAQVQQRSSDPQILQQIQQDCVPLVHHLLSREALPSLHAARLESALEASLDRFKKYEDSHYRTLLQPILQALYQLLFCVSWHVNEKESLAFYKKTGVPLEAKLFERDRFVSFEKCNAQLSYLAQMTSASSVTPLTDSSLQHMTQSLITFSSDYLAQQLAKEKDNSDAVQYKYSSQSIVQDEDEEMEQEIKRNEAHFQDCLMQEASFSESVPESVLKEDASMTKERANHSYSLGPLFDSYVSLFSYQQSTSLVSLEQMDQAVYNWFMKQWQDSFQNDDSLFRLAHLRALSRHNQHYHNSILAIDEKCRALESALAHLLELYPEQLSLQSMHLLCQRLLSSSLHQPKSYYLTGLNLLLTRAEQWEKVSGVTYSLKSVCRPLQQQLWSWQKEWVEEMAEKGLAEEELKIKEKSLYWWPHWLRLTLAQGEEEVEMAESWLETLDQFILSSGLGEFETRLQILDCLSHHLSSLKRHSASRLIQRLVTYYQFYQKRHIQPYLESSKVPIERSVQDAVKCHVWREEVNVLLWKQELEKLLRQVQKGKRDWREFLSRGVMSLMGDWQQKLIELPKENDNENENNITFQAMPNSNSDDSVLTRKCVQHCQTLTQVLMQKSQSCHFYQSQLRRFLDDMHSLASGTATQDKKLLQQMKRSLLSQVLKSCKQFGLKYRHENTLSLKNVFPVGQADWTAKTPIPYLHAFHALQSISVPHKDLTPQQVVMMKGHAQQVLMWLLQSLEWQHTLNQSVLLEKDEFLIPSGEVRQLQWHWQEIRVSLMLLNLFKEDYEVDWKDWHRFDKDGENIVMKHSSWEKMKNQMNSISESFKTVETNDLMRETWNAIQLEMNELQELVQSLNEQYLEFESVEEDTKVLLVIQSCIHVIQDWHANTAELPVSTLMSQWKSFISCFESMPLLKYSKYSPFLDALMKQVKECFQEWIQFLEKWSKSLTSIYSVLLVRGYCQEPDESLEEEENDGKTEEQDGLGLANGDTSKAKDVSEQIESEDQLNAKDNDSDQQEHDNASHKQEQGVSMQDEMNGSMHDLDDQEDDEENEENDEINDEIGETKQDAEKQPKNQSLDPDLWEDEKEEQGESEELNDEFNLGEQEDSLQAKENEGKSKDEQKNQNNEENEAIQDETKMNETDTENENELKDETENENIQVEQREHFEEEENEVKEDEEMELENDLEFDENENEMDDENNENNEDNDNQDNDFDPELDANELDNENNEKNVDEEKYNENELNKDNKETNDSHNLNENQLEKTQGIESNSTKQESVPIENKESNDSNEEDNSTPSKIPSFNNQNNQNDQNDPDLSLESSMQQQDSVDYPQDKSNQTKMPELKDLKDYWKETLQHLLEWNEKQNDPNNSQQELSMNELLAKSQNEQDELVLAPQTLEQKDEKNQVERENQDNLQMEQDNQQDEEKDLVNQNKDHAMDVDKEEEKNNKNANENKTKPELKPELNPELKNENVPSEENVDFNENEKFTILQRGLNQEEMSESDYETERVTESDTFVNSTLTENISSFEQEWQQYLYQMHSLSQDLTEQLRLILQPSVASHLAGDYRTGKRLSLKKVIHYIASDYRKDKIWLRRTLPKQRHFKVLVSVDNSQSMQRARPLALASVALLVQAMQQLDVGSFAVQLFGERVRLIQPWSSVASASFGSELCALYDCQEKRTDWMEMLQASQDLFNESDSSASHRLHLIISDGICDHHSSIQSLIKDHDKQCVVPILLDKMTLSAQQESILSMKRVQYATIQGKQVVQLTRYLDTFPFDYYVIVQELALLPSVLSETLRQFMEATLHD